MNTFISVIAMFFLAVVCSLTATAQTSKKLPNIIWITSEDNSPMLGCYGDTFATTPNLDKLASEGFLYTHAYANAPVCAPARNTILTGVYACSGGNQNMRSQYPSSSTIQFYPQMLSKLGYYCTNNSKEDYNIRPNQTEGIWDASGTTAHYKNRQPGQPFFAVFNSTISHESNLHTSIPGKNLRHSPDKVTLPPYHPNTPEMRHDWAQYYDKVEDMDKWVEKLLKELEESGEADNTIVFYYADHGGVLGRSKRFVYETGTHVPFIIRIPKKYKNLYPTAKPGDEVDRLISFVDLVPTLLSIAGAPIPDWLQGNAFLGAQKTADPQYAFMFRDRMDERFDLVRAVRDKRYRYIRNYMPYRIPGQHISYLWMAPSMASWEDAYLAGNCNALQSAFFKPKPSEELYDTENDPWEVNNLASNPAYQQVLVRMRKAQVDWCLKIFDTGFYPEGERSILASDTSFYDYMRNGSIPLPGIVSVAGVASKGDKENLQKLMGWMRNSNSAVRYWAATGLLILKEEARKAVPQLKQMLNDRSADNALIAAEALYNLGEKQLATPTLLKGVQHSNEMVRTHALNAIDYIDYDSQELRQLLQSILTNTNAITNNSYDARMAEWLLKKRSPGVGKS